MLSVTLDMNSIIDLEQNNAYAPFINGLIQMNRNGKVKLRIVAISASERKRGGATIQNFDEFKRRIDALGKAWRRWLNAKCDVLTMWSYIWYKGAGEILRPDETLSKLKDQVS